MGRLYADVYSAKISGSKIGKWRKVTPLPDPSARLTASVVDDMLIVAGGGYGRGTPVYSALYIAKIKRAGMLGEWRKVGDLPKPTAFHMAVVWPE